MKYLTLIRHAKSAWDQPGLSDHERHLNERGQATAPAMGKLLGSQWFHQDRDTLPFPRVDAVICSTAARARETAGLLLPHAGIPQSMVTLDDDLYLAPLSRLLQKARDLPDQAVHVIFIGHNGGLEEMVNALAGSHRSPEHFPTCAAALFRFPVEHWAEVDKGDGDLVALLRPREVLQSGK